MAFSKYRDEKDIFEMSFANQVSAAETISSPVVTVFRGVLDEWQDVTSEIAGVTVIVGSTVQFTLKQAATSTEQPEGLYKVHIHVVTNQSREISGEATLMVKA